MIDDDIDDHEIFKMAIDDLDKPVNCLFFPDCESAIAHFSENLVIAPGYVFIDLKLPRIDGDKCLQELQKLRQFDDPQIIIYSSSIPKDWEDRLSKMGVNDFIQKTESLPLLVDKIQDLIHSN